MTIGTVKWFDPRKGYGFLRSVDRTEDIFVHHTAIATEGFRTLANGESVHFNIMDGPRGPHATKVIPITVREPRER